MLEKIGLPAKPSMRGGNWVLDASNCQDCSSQFTIINRKHHCRRCGGLFCSSCTQQRMVLRGQGDSPVRICEPCKKLEEAARFELRYGHRKRTAKVNAKQIMNSEDEVLHQILGNGVKHVSEHELDNNSILDLQRVSSSASCSLISEESAAPGREGDIVRSISVDTHSHGTLDIMQGDPAELRQQAVEEKKKYKRLKAEGKSEEALQAFKRGKELERQAGVLEIALRKNRRMASDSSASVGIQKIDGQEEFGGKEKLTSQRGKGVKDDLAAELRELGWSDKDLHDSDKKPAELSLEGELSNLVAEVTPRPAQGAKKNSIDKSEVIALKKKALLLKREGKLAEAKEELRRAKILEKQLEEQELLGEAEDSDDELYALINAMDDDKQDGLVLDNALEAGLKFDNTFVSDHLPMDGNFEVTEDDMHDPDLAAALKSFGWSEEDEEQSASQGKQSVDGEALKKQVLSLKGEALGQKRAGNVAEAMELLKKAKLLEKDLEGLQSSSEMFASGLTLRSSSPQARRAVEKENAAETATSHFKSQPRSKLMIQKELLALKKKALTLRREGRIDEAEEELKKGKVLEQQLEEMENAPINHQQESRKGKILEQQQKEMGISHDKTTRKVGKKNLDSAHLHADADVRSLDPGEEAFETEVTEQDMQDPALLSILENLGWNENDNGESVSMMSTTPQHDSIPSVTPRKAKRSKADMQKELLVIKRKALALRRQGNTEAAEEELEKAKALENQMAEMEVSGNVNFMEVDSLGSSTSIPLNFSIKSEGSRNTGSLASVAANRMPNDEAVPPQNAFDVGLTIKSDKPEASPAVPKMLQSKTLMSGESALPVVEIPAERGFAQQLNQNKKMAGLLSGNDHRALPSIMDPVKREDKNVNVKPGIHYVSEENTTSESGKLLNTTSDFQNKESNVSKTNSSTSPESKLVHGVDAHRDEILARKRKAVALKREGKLAEAREELRQAKLMEKNMEVGQQDIVVKEVASTSTFGNTPIKKENKTSPSEKPMPARDRFKIQQESLSHKRNALKLRRAGKIDEADAELELAKSLEIQLEEHDQGSGGKSEATGDVIVEDLLDPQLFSVLRAIGLDDTPATDHPPKKAESRPNSDGRQNHRTEKADLEEQIKAEKLRALQFKREGKQAEALESLRSAKRLENKLASLA